MKHILTSLAIVLILGSFSNSYAEDSMAIDSIKAGLIAQEYLNFPTEYFTSKKCSLLCIDTVTLDSIYYPNFDDTNEYILAWKVRYWCDIDIFILPVFRDRVKASDCFLDVYLNAETGKFIKLQIPYVEDDGGGYPEYKFENLERKLQSGFHEILGPVDIPVKAGFFNIMQGMRAAYFKELDGYLLRLHYRGIADPLNLWILYFKGTAPHIPKGKGAERIPKKNLIYGVYIYNAETGRLISYSSAPLHNLKE